MSLDEAFMWIFVLCWACIGVGAILATFIGVVLTWRWFKDGK